MEGHFIQPPNAIHPWAIAVAFRVPVFRECVNGELKLNPPRFTPCLQGGKSAAQLELSLNTPDLESLTAKGGGVLFPAGTLIRIRFCAIMNSRNDK